MEKRRRPKIITKEPKITRQLIQFNELVNLVELNLLFDCHGHCKIKQLLFSMWFVYKYCLPLELYRQTQSQLIQTHMSFFHSVQKNDQSSCLYLDMISIFSCFLATSDILFCPKFGLSLGKADMDGCPHSIPSVIHAEIMHSSFYWSIWSVEAINKNKPSQVKKKKELNNCFKIFLCKHKS